MCRTAMANSMDQTALVLRETQTRDAGGGVISSYLQVGAYQCRAWHEENDQVDQDDSVRGTSVWSVLVPWNADVRVGDRISIAGLTLFVGGTSAGNSDQINILVTCAEVI